MVLWQPSKLMTRVRFPYPAPCTHRLSVRTPGFHPGKRSSILRGCTSVSHRLIEGHLLDGRRSGGRTLCMIHHNKTFCMHHFGNKRQWYSQPGRMFYYGSLVELVKTHACHAWNHGFESHTDRQVISRESVLVARESHKLTDGRFDSSSRNQASPLPSAYNKINWRHLPRWCNW